MEAVSDHPDRTETRHSHTHATQEDGGAQSSRQSPPDDWDGGAEAGAQRSGGRRGQLVDLATLSPPPLQQLTATDNAITAGTPRHQIPSGSRQMTWGRVWGNLAVGHRTIIRIPYVELYQGSSNCLLRFLLFNNFIYYHNFIIFLTNKVFYFNIKLFLKVLQF